MSATTVDLFKFVVVTDHDCGNYYIGEVDFRYSPGQLAEHIEKYGQEDLLAAINFLHAEIFKINVRTAGNAEAVDNE